ncbi:MAG: hypothetical protein UY04_C0052G0015, partial [Parcubacteria group bacterium GW2011_GWA2_47_7]
MDGIGRFLLAHLWSAGFVPYLRMLGIVNSPTTFRRKIISGFLILSFFVAPVQSALAATSLFPKEINYQAKLSDATNVTVPDGTYNVAFRLYTTPVSATT